MKNFLLMLGAVAFITACKDDGSGGKEFDSNEIYKHLSSVNVSDAKMIYSKEKSDTRSGDSESFGGVWKIDKNGNETKLVITGSDGKTNVINVFEISKLSDNILLMLPDWYDTNRIIQEWYNSQSDDGLHIDMSSEPHGAATEYAMLLNKETEKLYRFPENVQIPYNVGETYADKNGNIYYKGYSEKGDIIIKLNPETMTIESSFPEGQEFTNFDVTGDGFIMYWNDNTDDKNYKVKCPGGRIYPITDVPFMIKDELYSYKDKKIVKWETVGNNEMKETEVCEFNNLPDYASPDDKYEIHQVLNNYAKNSVVLRDNWGWYEFNGKTYNKVEIPHDFYWREFDQGCLYTNKAWYRQDNTRFNKLSMTDYQYSEFQILDYEIQSLSASSESPNIAFSGIRYMDGANVVGTITETDEIVIDNVAENGNKIINLIPLN